MQGVLERDVGTCWSVDIWLLISEQGWIPAEQAGCLGGRGRPAAPGETPAQRSEEEKAQWV